MHLMSLLTHSVAALAPVVMPDTMQCRRGVEGVYAASPALVAEVPGLRDWRYWYDPPVWLTNGHVHTIWAAKTRRAAGCRYARSLLRTPDGGSLALDLLAGEQEEVEYVEDDGRRGDARPVLLLLSGLGGGSQDSYVRCMAVAARRRGYRVAVLNMRGCANSPVTSPRFFSAFRGSTDDVALTVAALRSRFQPRSLSVLGWSNSGSIVINALSEGLDVDAACALAAPLNMPVSSANLDRWFHRNVYDRSIGSGLADKFRSSRHLFEDESGAAKAVPAWRGGTFVADVDLAATATTIRAIDEAITAPCFGFATVDDYYAYSSSDQRISQVRTPLLVVNAADDPIALWGNLDHVTDQVLSNPDVVFAATSVGGHLGWCDAADPRGQPGWIQRCALDFLQAALKSTSVTAPAS